MYLNVCVLFFTVAIYLKIFFLLLFHRVQLSSPIRRLGPGGPDSVLSGADYFLGII